MRRSYGISAFAAAAVLFGMSFQAGAMAPVISELPSVVVGNEEVASPPNAFVYPDALNLDVYVTDDTTTDGALIWSYENAGGRYRINNVDPLDGGNPDNPGTARLDNQDLDDEEDDSNPRTITIRDTVFSPVGGPNTAPPTTGIAANEIVTLYCSDGTTNSSKEMFIYTDNGGEDRLSPETTFVPVVSVDFLATAASTDWTGTVDLNISGGMTLTNVNGQGLCIQVPASAVVSGQWISPYNFIPVTANTVYRIRATVDAGTLPVNTTPLWGLVVDNFSVSPSVVENKFAQEYLILDNVGGANQASSAGITEFEFWFTPLAVLADDWNNETTGMFTAAKDAVNDVRVQFRVQDVDNIGYGGENDAGTVCLKSMSVDAFDINSLVVDSNVYDAQTLSDAEGQTAGSITGTHSVGFIIANSTNVAFSGGNLTVTPGTAGWSIEIISITPGNTVSDPLNNSAETPDNYPIVDSDMGLYRVQMGAQAPSAAAEANPPDGIRLGMDDATNEVLMTSNVLATTNLLGMPKAASVTTYTTFYQSHAVTAETVSETNRIRPRAEVLLSPSVGIPAVGTNAEGVTITSMTVDQMVRP
jgi:hypothetical protein